jgi:aldehyde dehydrogenase (NAD+)
MRHYGHYIDGTFTAEDGERIESVDPASGAVWATFGRGRADEADLAVSAAERAFRANWGARSMADRAAVLDRLADHIDANWETLVEAEVSDNGKRLAEVRAQFAGLGRWYRHFAALARTIRDEAQENSVPDVTSRTVYRPYGVVAAITPWNSPLMILAWKLAPALAAGNTVVVKPSELASASTLEFARLAGEAGLPAGVLNVVTGLGHEAGAALVRHPLVRKVSFTGSDMGGRKVAEGAARNVVPVTLELGGKSAQVVFADAPVEATVNGLMAGIFASNGQSCVAGSRLIVEASARDTIVGRLLERARTLRIGDPRDPATQVGPLANGPHLEKVRAMVLRAGEQGARCLMDGITGAGNRPGFYLGPTVFDRVTPAMEIWREEVFGPVLAITTFVEEREAIALANDSRGGLDGGCRPRRARCRCHRGGNRLHQPLPQRGPGQPDRRLPAIGLWAGAWARRRQGLSAGQIGLDRPGADARPIRRDAAMISPPKIGL